MAETGRRRGREEEAKGLRRRDPRRGAGILHAGEDRRRAAEEREVDAAAAVAVDMAARCAGEGGDRRRRGVVVGELRWIGIGGPL